MFIKERSFAMKNDLTKFQLIILITFLLTSCQKWIEIDLSRIAFAFIFSLAIGVVGLLFKMFKGRNKN